MRGPSTRYSRSEPDHDGRRLTLSNQTGTLPRRPCRQCGTLRSVMFRKPSIINNLTCAWAAALAAALVNPMPPAHAADAAICRELERRHELAKADIGSVQLNALLFAAAERGCEPL